MKDYDVNFNNKTILLEGEWFNVKELGEKIKYNINKGNYKIKHLSVALETLQEILESAQEIKISVLGTTYSRIEKMAKKYNKNVEIIIRDAIDRYLEINPIPSSENNSLDIDVEVEIASVEHKKKNTIKSKPEILKNMDKSPKNKPSIIENKEIKVDKEIKKQPSIIVNKEDSDDWFKQ